MYVPRYGETPPAGSVGSDSETKIDINRATAAELESLPGIGPSTAGRIVRARELKAFAKVEELQTRGLVSRARARPTSATSSRRASAARVSALLLAPLLPSALLAADHRARGAGALSRSRSRSAL